MPRPMTEQERQTFLAEPRVATLGVASDDDRPPLTVPIWFSYRPGGDLTLFTAARSRKAKLIQKAGSLSLSVQYGEIPYRYVTVEGAVIKVDQPPTAEQMVEIAGRYLTEEEARIWVKAEIELLGADLVLFTIRPQHWLTSDFSDD